MLLEVAGAPRLNSNMLQRQNRKLRCVRKNRKRHDHRLSMKLKKIHDGLARMFSVILMDFRRVSSSPTLSSIASRPSH